MKVIAGQASSEAWLKLLSSRLFSQSFSEDVESFCSNLHSNESDFGVFSRQYIRPHLWANWGRSRKAHPPFTVGPYRA
jgi:hypothetical protein